ncbi:MAG: hypothetical protein AAGA48_38850 [Myxococcota bacterium]
MPTELPQYHKVSAQDTSQDSPQGVWDVMAERSEDASASEPEPRAVDLHESAVPPEEETTQSELLSRFPRPGAAANRHDGPSRSQQVAMWGGAFLLLAASAAVAAWLVV